MSPNKATVSAKKLSTKNDYSLLLCNTRVSPRSPSGGSSSRTAERWSADWLRASRETNRKFEWIPIRTQQSRVLLVSNVISFVLICTFSINFVTTAFCLREREKILPTDGVGFSFDKISFACKRKKTRHFGWFASSLHFGSIYGLIIAYWPIIVICKNKCVSQIGNYWLFIFQ